MFQEQLVEVPDYASIRDVFCDELTKAARGQAASLPFIRNKLPASPLMQPNEAFQAFVIGGTNGCSYQQE